MLPVSLRKIFMLEDLCGLGSLSTSRTGNRMWSIYEILFKALPPLTARNSLFRHLHNYSVSKNSLSTPLGQTFVDEMYSCP